MFYPLFDSWGVLVLIVIWTSMAHPSFFSMYTFCKFLFYRKEPSGRGTRGQKFIEII